MAALEGIRILDLTQWEAGTSCTQLLAWLGADVIKVEPPGGDPGRAMISELPGKDGFYFLMFNANKRSLTLDLKQPKGRELLLELVTKCDVVAENFAEGVADKLEVGYETLRAAKPDLIYAAIRGYGSTGPYKDYKSFDMVAQAMGGVLSVNGTPETPPLRPGYTFADSGTGVHLGIAILAAYIERERTGKGQYVEVSMQDAMVNFGRSAFVAHYLTGGMPAMRFGNRVGLVSPTDLYPCTGGGPNDYVYIMCTTKRMWHGVLECIGRKELIGDDRYEEQAERNNHWDEVTEMISQWTEARDKYEVMRSMSDNGVPCGAVLDSADLFKDPHLRARDMIVSVEHPDRGSIDVPGCPIKMGNAHAVDVGPAPLLGQHSDQVLTEILGLGSEDIEALRSEGVL